MFVVENPRIGIVIRDTLEHLQQACVMGALQIVKRAGSSPVYTKHKPVLCGANRVRQFFHIGVAFALDFIEFGRRAGWSPWIRINNL